MPHSSDTLYFSSILILGLHCGGEGGGVEQIRKFTVATKLLTSVSMDRMVPGIINGSNG